MSVHLVSSAPTVPAPGQSWVSVLILVLGGLAPSLVTLWRANRVAREREQGTVWQQAQLFYTDAMSRQERENVALRRRIDVCETDLARAVRRVDQLIGLCDTHDLTVPPRLLTRPWEHNDSNGGTDPPKPP